RLALERFEGSGGDAGDQVRLVARVNVAEAVLPGEKLAVLAGVVVVTAAEDDVGAEPLHRGDLHRVGPFRHADRRLDAEEPRREGDRLPVVSRRGGDQA